MHKGRLEAFSDGVIAIIITIMVLEFKVPHDSNLSALVELLPVFLSYVLSFIYVGIYWNNHHHLLQATNKIHGGILWANLHLLFWLSLIPFSTAWMGENHFADGPAAVYGVVLLMCAIAYFILQNSLIKHHGNDSTLAKAIGADHKGKISVACYVAGIVLSHIVPWASFALYVFVAMLWLVPDRRIEQAL
ncbi:MAG: TMEM175 family protein [Bdellovibrionota bacterium]